MDVLLTCPNVLFIIDNLTETQGLKQSKIIEANKDQRSKGFLGQIVTVKVKANQSDEELNLFIKLAFSDKLVREIVPVRLIFENEVYFYSEVYNTFENFAKSCGFPKPIQLVPKCYEVSLVENAEVLVLEDLKTQGFEYFDNTLQLDHDHVKIIFQAYGRFHAYSYAYQDQQPEKFKELAGRTRDVYTHMVTSQSFLEMLHGAVDAVEKLLEPGKDDAIIKRFEKYNSKNILQTCLDAATINCDHAILIHGDCWSNNMMFKYEKTGKEKMPVDIRLIDWQVIKQGSPVCDLSYFLYSGASKDILNKLDYYLRIYYDTLSSMLKALGSNPEKLFSFNVLKQQWKIYAKYGICMSFIVIKANLTNHNEDLFNDRIKDLLEHTIEVDAL